MPASSKLLAASVAAVGIGVVAARVASNMARPKYILHVYDHCPFCNRVEYLMQHFGLEYNRVVYAYGAGAKPDVHGYESADSPLFLTGKKMLPVLVGDGVPVMEGAIGMPESMEICAFLIARHRLVVPCDSGRPDVKKFTAELTALKPELVDGPDASRMVRMPVKDWEDPRDVHYRRHKKGFSLEPPPVVSQPEPLARLNAKLRELPALLRGGTCLNAWGWGIDDVLLLPNLRAFTVVKGAKFPPEVVAYMAFEGSQMMDYRPHAL